MLVNIDKKERDTIARVCAISSCKVRFFTNETNPLVLQAEILDYDGNEISPRDAWYIGRTIVWSIATDEIKTL